MTTESPGSEEVDRPLRAATNEDERPAYDEGDGELPDHLEVPIETPEADALEQALTEPLEDDDRP